MIRASKPGQTTTLVRAKQEGEPSPSTVIAGKKAERLDRARQQNADYRPLAKSQQIKDDVQAVQDSSDRLHQSYVSAIDEVKRREQGKSYNDQNMMDRLQRGETPKVVTDAEKSVQKLYKDLGVKQEEPPKKENAQAAMSAFEDKHSDRNQHIEQIKSTATDGNAYLDYVRDQKEYQDYVQKGREMTNTVPVVESSPATDWFTDLFQSSDQRARSTGQGAPQINNKVTFSRDIDKKMADLSKREQDYYRGLESYSDLYSYMTEDEVDYYSFLLASDGTSRADAWLSQIKPALQDRKVNPQTDWMSRNPRNITAEEYEQKAQIGLALKNPTLEDVLQDIGVPVISVGAPADASKSRNVSSGHFGPLEVKNKVTFSRALDAEYNKISEGLANRDAVLRYKDVEGYNELYSFMTEEEVKEYSFLLQKYSEEEADAWVTLIKPELNDRRFKPMAEWTQQNFFTKTLGTVGGVVANVAGAFQSAPANIAAYLTGEEIDPYSRDHYLSNVGEAQTGAVADSIQSPIKKAAYQLSVGLMEMGVDLLVSKGLGKALGGASKGAAALNSVDDVAKVTKGITSIVYRTSMSARTFSRTVKDAKERGLTDNQAMGLGILSAGIEWITEKYSIEALLDDPQKVGQYVLKNIGTEGTEEGASNILNFVADMIVSGDKSAYKLAINRYMTEEKLSEEDALARALMDQAISFGVDVLGGMIGGGVFAVPGAVSIGARNGKVKQATRTMSNQLVQGGMPKAEAQEVAKVVVKAESGQPLTAEELALLYQYEGNGQETAPRNPAQSDAEVLPQVETAEQAAPLVRAGQGQTTAQQQTAAEEQIPLGHIDENGRIQLAESEEQAREWAQEQAAKADTQAQPLVRAGQVATQQTAQEPEIRQARFDENGRIQLAESEEQAREWAQEQAAANLQLTANQDQQTGGMSNGTEQGTNAVSYGGQERYDGVGTGRQAGRMAGGTEGRAAAAERSRAAIRRQNRAADLRLPQVSTRSLGIENGTDLPIVTVMPESEWDDAMRATAQRVQAETGLPVQFFVGKLQITTTGGETAFVRGAYTAGGIYVQADNMLADIDQIADHEMFHAMAAQDQVLVATAAERIRETFSEAEFDEIVQRYKEAYEGIYDEMDDSIMEEILADAYAGINSFGAVAYTDTVRQTVAQRFGRSADVARDGASRAPPRATENPADVGGAERTRWSVDGKESTKKIAADMSDTERAKIIVGKTIYAPIYEGQADSLIAENESDLQSAKSGLVKKAMLAIYEQFRIDGSLYNPDMEIIVEMSNGTVKESANKQIKNTEQLAKLLPVLEGAVQGAVGIECHKNRYYGDRQTKDFVELLGGYIEGDAFVPVRFGIKRADNGRNALYVIIGENKMEAEVVKTLAPTKTEGRNASRSTSAISIHKVIQNVNSENIGLLKYLPDDLLNSEQLDGKHRGVVQTKRYTKEKNDKAYEKFISKRDIAEAKDMLRRLAADRGYTADTEWRMNHRAPNAMSDTAKSLDAVDGIYGGDGSIYSVRAEQYYGEGRDYDRDALRIIRSVRNNPDAMVTIYRAVPLDVQDTKVRNGDWITITKAYAEEHGENVLDGQYRIVENTVPAKHIYADGDSIHEYGYDNGSAEVYKNTPNNAKSAEITYDNDGNLIPFSERYDEKKRDVRFSVDPKPAGFAEWPEGMTVDEWNAAANQRREEEKAARFRTIPKAEFKGTEAMDKLGIRIEGTVTSYDNADMLRANNEAARSIEKETRKAERRMNPTKKEKNVARQIAAGVLTTAEIPRSVNASKVLELVDYYSAGRAMGESRIRFQKRVINARLDEKMAELFADSDDHVPSNMLTMNYRTPERNMLKIFGEEQGRKIYEEIFAPVTVNEAEKYRFLNRMLDAVRTFEGADGVAKELSRDERALVQMVIEGRAAAEEVARMETRPMIEAVAQNLRNGLSLSEANETFDLTNSEQKLAQRYANWLQTQEQLESTDVDQVRIDNAVATYSEKFNQFYEAINDFLVVHGYEPIGFIKGYAPHMQSDETQGRFNKVLESLGINTDVTKLPTSIAGQTADFKPGKRYNPYFMKRQGDSTDYDIATAYESYVDFLSDVLYHTDDIMRVRRAAAYFRRTYSPEEISENLSWAQELRFAPTEDKIELLQAAGKISAGTHLSAGDAAAAMDDYIDELYKNIEKTTKYSGFVMWLDNYANILASKQSMADRGWEYEFDRPILNLGNKLTAAFGRANVAGNLSSAMNQSAQLPMIVAECGANNVRRAVQDIISGKVRRAGFAEESDFLTGKRGVNGLVSTGFDKAVNGLFKPVEFVDTLMSTIAVRAAWHQAIQNGASQEEAMAQADRYGAHVMGSRMKGEKPLGFHSKNPVANIINIFQVEALNTWEHVSQDLPREFRDIEKSVGKKAAARQLAAVIAKCLIAAFVLNRITEELYGGTPAPFDLLGLSANFIASGEGLTVNEGIRTLLDNGWEKLTGERLFDTKSDSDREFDWGAALEDTSYNVMNEIPFVRNASALLGLGDQTLPLPDVYGTGKKIVESVTDEDGVSWDTAESAGEFLAQFMPGGRQFQKTYEGVKTMAQGGSYKGHGKEKKLQYPVDGTWDEWIRAVMFGKAGLNENDEFYASGDTAISEKQTDAYEEVVDMGADRKEVYNTIQSIRREKDARAKRDVLEDADLTDEQKARLYSGIISDERDEEFAAMMDAGMGWADVMDVYNVWYELDNNKEMKASEKAMEFAMYADRSGLSEDQAAVVKEQLKFYTQMPVEAGRYEGLSSAGLSSEVAQKVYDTVSALKPEEGHTTVSYQQKYKAIVGMNISESQKKAALSQYMTDSTYKRMEAVYAYSVTPTQYVNYITAADKDGNGNTTQMEATVYLHSMTELNRKQRAALWQATNKSWKAGNNPFDQKIGAEVKRTLDAE